MEIGSKKEDGDMSIAAVEKWKPSRERLAGKRESGKESKKDGKQGFKKEDR